MAGFEYTPDEEIEVHEEGAIKLICAAFQTHENGLPEWIKNASDEYARRDAPSDSRVIVVFCSSGRRSQAPSISVLDFGGMTSEVIENRFRHWADPEAAQGASAAQVQGGHGNGGKCYMTMMFQDHAQIHSVREGLGIRYGVAGDSVKFGYIPDQDHGRNFLVSDVARELEEALAALGVPYAALPDEAKAAFEESESFTLVTGSRPKGWEQIRVLELVGDLVDHAQMMTSLQFCKVYVMNNGAVVPGADPLRLKSVAPDPGFAEDRVIAIPGELEDPRTGASVSTTDNGKAPTGRLVLKTSNVSMRWSRKARHTIVYHARSGFIGSKPVPEFDVRSTFADRIYGDCYLQSLELMKQNARAALADSPLTRAMEAFISRAIENYAREFEERDRRKVSQQEKTELRQVNELLDAWKNHFMTRFLQAMWGPGGSSGPDTRQPLPAGIPARIEVSLSHGTSGVGVSFRPAISFYDKEGRRIRPTPYRWWSEDSNVAFGDQDLNVITTFDAGSTVIRAETLDGRLASDRVALEVVRIRSVELRPTELEVPLGSRQKIEALCHLSNGDVLSDIYLIWMESNPTVAQVSAAGHVFGHSLGTTEVVAGDDRCMAEQAARVTVVEPQESGGRGTFPKILLSSIDNDPDTGEPMNLPSDVPPVFQRPQDADRNIWWINTSSPLATMYLGQPYGSRSREWRMYHVERTIEVMTQIALANDPDRLPMDVDAWVSKWGDIVTKIQVAAAGELASFIADGDKPLVA